MKMSSNVRGAIFAVTGFSLFAFGDAGYKYLSGHYSIYSTIFFTSLAAFLALLAFAALNGGVRAAVKTNRLRLHILRGLLVMAQVTLIVTAFSHLSLAKTYAIAFIAPFIATVLSIPLLRETVPARQWAAIGLGFAGVLIVLRPGMIPVEPAVFAALASAFIFALTNVMVRIIGTENETRLSFAFYVEAVIVPLSFLLALTDFEWPSPFDALVIVFIGVTAAAGMYCLARGFAEAPPAVAAPFHYTQMLWGIALGWVIFGDALDLWMGIGSAVIVASGLWLIWQEKTSGASKTAAPLPLP